MEAESRWGGGRQFEGSTKGWCVREGWEAEQIKKRRRKGRMGGNIWGGARVLGRGLELRWSGSPSRMAGHFFLFFVRLSSLCKVQNILVERRAGGGPGAVTFLPGTTPPPPPQTGLHVPTCSPFTIGGGDGNFCQPIACSLPPGWCVARPLSSMATEVFQASMSWTAGSGLVGGPALCRESRDQPRQPVVGLLPLPPAFALIGSAQPSDPVCVCVARAGGGEPASEYEREKEKEREEGSGDRRREGLQGREGGRQEELEDENAERECVCLAWLSKRVGEDATLTPFLFPASPAGASTREGRTARRGASGWM